MHRLASQCLQRRLSLMNILVELLQDVHQLQNLSAATAKGASLI
jgi:hypothetical protein